MVFYKKDLRSFMEKLTHIQYEERSNFGNERFQQACRKAFGREYEIPGGMWVYPDGSQVSIVLGTAGIGVYYTEGTTRHLEIHRHWYKDKVIVMDSFNGTTELYNKLSSVSKEYTI